MQSWLGIKAAAKPVTSSPAKAKKTAPKKDTPKKRPPSSPEGLEDSDDDNAAASKSQQRKRLKSAKTVCHMLEIKIIVYSGKFPLIFRSSSSLTLCFVSTKMDVRLCWRRIVSVLTK